jgi:hypothetical protein
MTDSSLAAAKLNAIIRVLGELDDETRARVLSAVNTFFKAEAQTPISEAPERSARPSFSETAPSPKEFLLQKQPKTDVERVACLAYYLAHYRDTAQFKTLDLAKLNTEAAQPKFSNAASAAKNAVKMGYLVAAVKGQRQISAAAEQFVLALPNREAARAAMTQARPRRLFKKKKLYRSSIDQ